MSHTHQPMQTVVQQPQVVSHTHQPVQ
jgi:hypothetical protein